MRQEGNIDLDTPILITNMNQDNIRNLFEFCDIFSPIFNSIIFNIVSSPNLNLFQIIRHDIFIFFHCLDLTIHTSLIPQTQSHPCRDAVWLKLFRSRDSRFLHLVQFCCCLPSDITVVHYHTSSCLFRSFHSLF